MSKAEKLTCNVRLNEYDGEVVSYRAMIECDWLPTILSTSTCCTPKQALHEARTMCAALGLRIDNEYGWE